MLRLPRERILIIVLLAAVIAVWWLALGALDNTLTLTVLDVGQGDSILIQAPGGRNILIDAGGRHGQEASRWDIGREVVLPSLLARRVTKIDVLIITHPHEDHIGGISAILDALPVGLVLDPMLETTSATYRTIVSDIENRNIPWHRATEGQRLNLGRGIYADILNPPDPRLQFTGSDLNNNSVVLHLIHGDIGILLAADIDREGAYRIAKLGENARSAILKVPHHGSSLPAIPEFIDAVNPQLAIISVGQGNTFGHPSDEMLRELDRIGAKVLRTDRDGAVTITIRPDRWSAIGSSPVARRNRLTGHVAPPATIGMP